MSYIIVSIDKNIQNNYGLYDINLTYKQKYIYQGYNYMINEFSIKDTSEIETIFTDNIDIYYYGNMGNNNLPILRNTDINSIDDIINIFANLKDNYMLFAFDKVNKLVAVATSYLPIYVKRNNSNIQFYTYEAPFTTLLDMYSLYIYDIEENTLKDKIVYNFDEDKNVLVIHSGGLDSSIMIPYFIENGYKVKTLFFNYGQNAYPVEDFATSKIADYYNIERITFDLRPIFKEFNATLLKGDKNIDTDMHTAHNTYYVPNRNGIMTNIALAIAEQNNIHNIAIGVNYTERNFPDNTDYFTKYANQYALTVLKAFYKVNILTPFKDKTKKEIALLAKKYNFPIEYIVSCYYPELENNKIKECGICPSCINKIQAFAD